MAALACPPPRRGPTRPPRRPPRGQALIEFAIIAMLLILLVAGGVELFNAAVGGQRVRAAAEAAAEQWRAVVGAHGRAVLGLPAASGADIGLPYGLAAAASSGAAEHGLGDHDFLAFGAPGCEEVVDGFCVAPAHGLPEPADRPDTPELEGDVYLFNPVPIDVTACVPEGRRVPAHEACVRRIFEGCAAASSPGAQGCLDDHPGLPPLNRALFGLYQLHCIDENGSFNPDDARRPIACPEKAGAATEHVRWVLRLPGKHFLKPADVAEAEEVALAAGLEANPCPEESTCLTVVDTTAEPVLAVFADGQPNPKPMFELACGAASSPDGGFGPCDTRDEPASVCWAPPVAGAASAAPVPLACRVRAQVRHRHHFNGLLATAFYSGVNATGRPLPEALTRLLDRGVQVTGLCLSASDLPETPALCEGNGLAVQPLANFAQDPGAGGYGADLTAQGSGRQAAASGPDWLERHYFLIPAKDFLGCASTSVQVEGAHLRAPSLSCN